MLTRKFLQQQNKQHLLHWKVELSERFGVDLNDFEQFQMPLSAFAHSVNITFQDGSELLFHDAFCLVSNANDAIAIFTEHCGYHTFSSHSVRVVIDHAIFFECPNFG